MKVEDLIDMAPKTRKTIESNRLYAVQENGTANGEASGTSSVRSKRPSSQRRYARISIDSSERLFLHALGKEDDPPDDAYLLKHEDLMKTTDASNRLAFLELADEGEQPLGRILIRLSPDTNFARQFTLLCTGELGHSYANSNILKVMYPKEQTESVFFGDYESNDGEGGRAIIEGPDWTKEHMRGVYKRPWVAGVVGGWGWAEDRASQFAIHTRHCDGFELPGCFALVEEGLSIITKALAKHDDITKLYIKDCGILLCQRESK